MAKLHDRETRGTTRTDWLNSRHTFSFGHFHDPARMGFGSLRVINDDRVIPGAGFAPHSHQDMEILTYVLSGALAHKDSLGNGSIIRPGEIQRMSAGHGIQHSEMNASKTDPVHFLQIWIMPADRGITPSYEQVRLPVGTGEAGFTLIAGPTGAPGAVKLHQDAELSLAKPQAGEVISLSLPEKRRGFLHVAKGAVHLGETPLRAGDGVAFDGGVSEALTADAEAEVLLFNVA